MKNKEEDTIIENKILKNRIELTKELVCILNINKPVVNVKDVLNKKRNIDEVSCKRGIEFLKKEYEANK